MMAGRPYCGDCGQTLDGVEEWDCCPGCGKPVADVLTRDPVVRGVGKRWESKTRLFGLPLVHIAQGPHGDERIGKARGIIAIGDVAVGWFAVGGFSAGIVAVGGVSIGLVSLAGLAVGLLALGGLAIGGGAAGGGAIGGIAIGGGAVGYVAIGGGAVGHYVQAGGGYGTHVIDGAGRDAEAVRFFSEWNWLLGSSPAQSYRFVLWILVGAAAVALLLALLVLLAYVARPREYDYP